MGKQHVKQRDVKTSNNIGKAASFIKSMLGSAHDKHFIILLFTYELPIFLNKRIRMRRGKTE